MRPLTWPLDLSSAQEADDFQDLAGYHEAKHSGQRYGRDSNAVALAVERELERRQPGYRALLFQSGMAACAAIIDELLIDRILWLPSECYRKMHALTERLSVIPYEDHSETSLPAVAETDVVWAESPSNPHLKLADYQTLEWAKNEGATVILDLTFAGLNNWNGGDWPDIILHSATKYIGGHNDLMGGLIFCKPDSYGPLWDRRSYAGGIIDPMSAWLLARSLKTYDIRMAKQLANAYKVRLWLAKSHLPFFYPAACQQHDHGGAVVSFLAEGTSRELTDLCGAMRTVKMAPSFGSVDSLIEVPATMSRYGATEAELAASGIEPNLIRLSVGVEPIDDIVADLESLA